MTPPTVTIAIASYNRRELLPRAMLSVEAQDYSGDIEIVVVDDGSTDGTMAVIDEVHDVAWRGNRPLVVTRHPVNRGIAAAKNTALRSGSGDLRGILDSDDHYHPAFVSRCVAELQAHPEVVCTYSDNWRTFPDGQKCLEKAADWSIEALLRCQLRGDCYLARWSALERTGLHDERMELEVDYDLFYALSELGPLRHIPEALQTVTEHAGRTSGNRERAAYWHAVGLGKWGHSIDWAHRRAAGHPEWHRAIADGYALGASWRGGR